MRGDILVTGGSDGSVRVWSLQAYSPIHRLAAHDNSVTSLQFDDSRIVSGGSDGRVKIWDTRTGALIRELSQPAEAVWRVAFESERCVVMASRGTRTIMEVWDFTPPADTEDNGSLERRAEAAAKEHDPIEPDEDNDEDDDPEEGEDGISRPPIDECHDESRQAADHDMMDLEIDNLDSEAETSARSNSAYIPRQRTMLEEGGEEMDDS